MRVRVGDVVMAEEDVAIAKKRVLWAAGQEGNDELGGIFLVMDDSVDPDEAGDPARPGVATTESTSKLGMMSRE